ncbi:MAG TPA: Lrp/AsnC family transcriptional regulator [Firmicutes bacterium]|nr:Lrp/AsnC family transcriptional regulator [Bacillota bacterium]
MLRKRLLEILQDSDRYTPAQLATMLGVTEEEIKSTLKELEDSGVIIKYHAVIDWEKSGEEIVTALIEVKVTPQREVGFDDVARRIYLFPEVRSVYLISGDYDLSVVIEGKSMRDVAFFVAEKLATIEHVQSTATHFVLKKYKQNGVIIGASEQNHRLEVSP